MNDSWTSSAVRAAAAPPYLGVAPCTRCAGAGGWRYVYCTSCREYVNGRYGEISPADELKGRRPPIITECGHEAYSLPGQIICTDCDGTGFSQLRAA